MEEMFFRKPEQTAYQKVGEPVFQISFLFTGPTALRAQAHGVCPSTYPLIC